MVLMMYRLFTLTGEAGASPVLSFFSSSDDDVSSCFYLWGNWSSSSTYLRFEAITALTHWLAFSVSRSSDLTSWPCHLLLAGCEMTCSELPRTCALRFDTICCEESSLRPFSLLLKLCGMENWWLWFILTVLGPEFSCWLHGEVMPDSTRLFCMICWFTSLTGTPFQYSWMLPIRSFMWPLGRLDKSTKWNGPGIKCFFDSECSVLTADDFHFQGLVDLRFCDSQRSTEFFLELSLLTLWLLGTFHKILALNKLLTPFWVRFLFKILIYELFKVIGDLTLLRLCLLLQLALVDHLASRISCKWEVFLRF